MEEVIYAVHCHTPLLIKTSVRAIPKPAVITSIGEETVKDRNWTIFLVQGQQIEQGRGLSIHERCLLVGIQPTRFKKNKIF